MAQSQRHLRSMNKGHFEERGPGARAAILKAERENAAKLITSGHLLDPIKHVYPR